MNSYLATIVRVLVWAIVISLLATACGENSNGAADNDERESQPAEPDRFRLPSGEEVFDLVTTDEAFAGLVLVEVVPPADTSSFALPCGATSYPLVSVRQAFYIQPVLSPAPDAPDDSTRPPSMGFRFSINEFQDLGAAEAVVAELTAADACALDNGATWTVGVPRATPVGQGVTRQLEREDGGIWYNIWIRDGVRLLEISIRTESPWFREGWIDDLTTLSVK